MRRRTPARGNGTSLPTSSPNSPPAKARATASSARCSRSATRSSRSFRFRARRRTNSICAAGELKKKFKDAGLKFDPVNLHLFVPFGTGDPAIGRLRVSGSGDLSQHPSAENDYPLHHALDDAGPGLIELWELQKPDDKQDIEGWRAPFDAVSVTSPEVRLAKRIQAEIKSLVESGTMTGRAGDRRPLRYGDMLVLVRRRGNAFDAVIQALKHANIPVAGADRLKLTEHIAIIDLMNLADALLLPQDDLALAVALKSPLFGLDDDDLFKLAWQRRGSLREALRRHAATMRNSASLWSAWKHARAVPCSETPFAFYAWLLGGDGGRQRILRRLGHEANDALDEFLELALGYERKAPASLQGFMAWLRTADTRGEARHGNFARRGARHDRARRQGTGGAGGVSGGYHVVAVGYAAAAADPFAAG